MKSRKCKIKMVKEGADMMERACITSKKVIIEEMSGFAPGEKPIWTKKSEKKIPKSYNRGLKGGVYNAPLVEQTKLELKGFKKVKSFKFGDI